MRFGSLGKRITIHKEKTANEWDWNMGENRLEYGIWVEN